MMDNIWILQVAQLAFSLLMLLAMVVGIVIGLANRDRSPNAINKMVFGLVCLLFGQVLMIVNMFMGRFLSVEVTAYYYLGASFVIRGIDLLGIVLLCAAALSDRTDPYAGKQAISPPYDAANPYS